jgi:methyl-accepting chemotaxis protein
MGSDLKRVTEAAQELGLTSGDIQAIIKTIDHIVSQANLLARSIAADTACGGDAQQERR